jgi:hypothetical protein
MRNLSQTIRSNTLVLRQSKRRPRTWLGVIPLRARAPHYDGEIADASGSSSARILSMIARMPAGS